MLNPKLEESLNNAVMMAADAHHEFVSLEHVLLSIIDTAKAEKFFQPVVPM